MDMLAAETGRRPSEISQEVASCGSSSVSERQDHMSMPFTVHQGIPKARMPSMRTAARETRLWSQRTITAFSTLIVMLLKPRSRICVRVHGSYSWLILGTSGLDLGIG